jgi:hypothetical protein
MLVTLFRGDAVDEARRPDCPGPRVASRGDRMGRRLIFGSYRIDAAQQLVLMHVLAATCELDWLAFGGPAMLTKMTEEDWVLVLEVQRRALFPRRPI